MAPASSRAAAVTTSRRSSARLQHNGMTTEDDDKEKENVASDKSSTAKKRSQTKGSDSSSDVDDAPLKKKKKRVSPTSAKKSKAASKKTSSGDEIDGEGSYSDSVSSSASSSRKKKTKASSKKKKKAKSSDGESDDESKGSKTGKRKVSLKKKKSKGGSDSDGEEGSKEKKASPKKKRAKAEPHQIITERDPLPKLWDAQKGMEEHGSYTFKIMSWNVAGLRAVLRNHPDALPKLAVDHNLDVICLQETKLQEMHVEDPKLKIQEVLQEQGYTSYYSCATSKKGYSGTAVFVKNYDNDEKKETKKQASMTQFFGPKKTKTKSNTQHSSSHLNLEDVSPHTVSYGLGDSKHDTEGRAITIQFPLFSLTNLYVPNSGQKLERLQYRTQEWDTDLLQNMSELSKTKPVIYLGDLNVAHTYQDVWNEGAKHLAKSAGTTQEERDSFANQLSSSSFVDAFRHLHPDKMGQYTYWSQRAGNRTPNKGLRLDYFVCSATLFEDDNSSDRVVVRDSYILPEQMGSDHCPIVLELEVKKKL